MVNEVQKEEKRKNKNMKEVIYQIFNGYNNNPHYLGENFYNDLFKIIRNEPNKIDFLNTLEQEISLEYEKHCLTCTVNELVCYNKLAKEISIKIINTMKKDITESKQFVNIDNSTNKNIVNDSIGVSINQNMENKSNESWFKNNVKYLYYIFGVIGFSYSFFKWLLPLFQLLNYERVR